MESNEIINNGKGQKKMRALKRLTVVAAFLRSGHDPAGMVLDAIPVIPPELRPDIPSVASRVTIALIAAKCKEHRQKPKFVEVNEKSDGYPAGSGPA